MDSVRPRSITDSVTVGLSGLALSARLRPAASRGDASSLIDPQETHANAYIGSDACSVCHPYQHASWQASYHRSMTQVASPQSILAPFDGTELTLEGTKWRLERRGGAYWVRGEMSGSQRSDLPEIQRRIVMTTGSHNYQLYWMESAGISGMQPFPFVYLLYDRVWIPRKSRFLMPPVARTPDETGRWSVHCIKCHATRGQPRTPPDGATRVAELGISCEACHGPGAEHARRNRTPLRRFRLYATSTPDPTIVNPARLSPRRSTQACAQCHSIEVFLTPEKAADWRRDGSLFRPGEDLSEFQTTVIGRYQDNPPDVREYLDRHPDFQLRNCFWPDGVARLAGREYNGLLDSPCYKQGDMSCLSCHRLHRAKNDPRSFTAWADDQLGVEGAGNGTCVQCHARYADPQVSVAHSHHAVDSEGSRCANCHMPYTTWGLLRAIRSHTVTSPDVATSVSTGRPNACNQCHLDRTLLWTAEKLTEWYDIKAPLLCDDERTVAASILWSLSGDAVQRAIMTWSMGWEPARRVSGTRWMVPFLSILLVDPYDAVRFGAQRSLRLFPEYSAMAADSVAGATLEEQTSKMNAIFTSWQQAFPASAGRYGPHLLIGPGGTLDQRSISSLLALRKDYGIVLFE